jgi:hypothetical protein
MHTLFGNVKDPTALLALSGIKEWLMLRSWDEVAMDTKEHVFKGLSHSGVVVIGLKLQRAAF